MPIRWDCDCGACCNTCGHDTTCSSNNYDEGREAWNAATDPSDDYGF